MADENRDAADKEREMREHEREARERDSTERGPETSDDPLAGDPAPPGNPGQQSG